MDGMHRVAKAYINGHERIEVVQFHVTPEPDYIGVEAEELHMAMPPNKPCSELAMSGLLC